MTGQATTHDRATSQVLRFVAGVALALAVLLAAVLMISSSAQACPQDRGTDTPAAASQGPKLHRPYAQLVVSAAPSIAKVAVVATGCCGAGSHAGGVGCTSGCCAACSSAVLPDMMPPVDTSRIALPHAWPKPDGASLANPGPALRPPCLLG